MQGPEVKFNEFLGDMHPEVMPIPEQIVFIQDPLLLKRAVDELFFLQLFIYSLMTVWLLSKTFKKRHLSFFSNADRRYSWLRNFSLAILFFLLIKLIQLAFFERDLGDYIAAIFITLLVYGVSFTVIKRSSLFSETLVSRAQKYEKSSLTEESKQRIKKILEQVMKEEKLYLDYSLSLPSLAKKIRVSPHHLSQVLNDCLNRNFYSYIADFRIRDAQQILIDPAQANIKLEEVAEMVGYNSKPAFNAAFKKLTGMTPSKFRESRTKKTPDHSNH